MPGKRIARRGRPGATVLDVGGGKRPGHRPPHGRRSEPLRRRQSQVGLGHGDRAREPAGCSALDAARTVWEESGRQAAGKPAPVMRCAACRPLDGRRYGAGAQHRGERRGDALRPALHLVRGAGELGRRFPGAR